MTNLEYFIGLPVRELAIKLEKSIDYCPVCNCRAKNCDGEDCIDQIVEWLEAEHEEEIIKCPFCGSENIEIIKDVNRGYILICHDCFANTSFASSDKSMTISKWNTRV